MRENGFYWVRMDGEWLIAQWEDETNDWQFDGEYYISHALDEIDERRIVREKNNG